MITRRTPLKRSTTRIRSVSQKRAAQLRIYSGKRRQFLAEHLWCAVFPDQRATEIHHKNHRHGERLNDETQFLAVSRAGHIFIHRNAGEARRKGWLI